MKKMLFLSCLALLAVIVQSTSFLVQKKDSVTKYSLKLSSGTGEEYDEKIEIDAEKETETFHVPKTSPDEEAGDIVYDFKKKMTMIRLPAAKACYLTHSTDDALKPADLMKALALVPPKTDGGLPKARTDINLTVVGTLEDRSELSDEMARLCAKLPVYAVVKGDVNPIDFSETRQTPNPENALKARK
ncbi:uncharacterized protein [Porites lutea]|uniref:uncharacterized protein n=1 Tax=Porites lutea TaxID=51062 RepID=UPI003CC532D7